MGKNRDGKKQITTRDTRMPVDKFRKEIGTHQEAVLSESSVRKRVVSREKKTDKQQVVVKKDATPKQLTYFGVILIFLLTGLYLILSKMGSQGENTFIDNE